GAVGPKSTVSARACPARWISAWPIPPRPEFQGSTDASASAVATAASIALPPASSTATPASAALLTWETTTPRLPDAEGFSRRQFWVVCGDGVNCMTAMIAGGRHAASPLGTWQFAVLSSPHAGPDRDQTVRSRRRGLGGLHRRWLHRPGRPVL